MVLIINLLTPKENSENPHDNPHEKYPRKVHKKNNERKKSS